MEEKKNKRQETGMSEQQAERLEREALIRKVARAAEEDNVQAMIERSIKDHGA